MEQGRLKKGQKGARRYHIITLGCQMNERDSETVAGLIEGTGYVRAKDRDEADIIVVNTCSVRDNADQKFFGILGQIKKLKEKNPDLITAVCGCMMQQVHVRERIAEKFAWVDIIFGPMSIHKFPELVEMAHGRKSAGKIASPGKNYAAKTVNPAERDGNAAAKSAKIAAKDANAANAAAKDVKAAGKGVKAGGGIVLTDVAESMGDPVEGLPAIREFRHKAFVNIMYGCNNFCSYCIVPYTRGREVSRAPGRIIEEVRGLAENGTKEVTLLGQNVNSYAGFALDEESRSEGGVDDTGGKPVDLAALVLRLEGIGPLARIRFMTPHPKDLSDSLIGLYARRGKKLCPGIHLPVQSGSSRVLGLMNRQYDKASYLKLIGKLREADPDIVISTDLIVGFPGETEEDFEETMDLIERVRYDSAFTFIFSPRRGTPAASMDGQIPDEVKHRRFDRMVKRLNAITLEKNKAFIGEAFEVLIDGFSKNDDHVLSGRTPGGKLVNFAVPETLTVPERKALTGELREVRVTDVNTFSFKGELV
ncbi:MAG: MiaB/RimO family radical SAM methylthiotransferase [Clostridiales Family XIII bacterium]|jgi:tRNA-2-methylthio-N6-dimethylallyladenosine synthase|nr:MiaB/RimO family radical SAM methylthiotransferase [Clostridiales Family XIII bacterium]